MTITTTHSFACVKSDWERLYKLTPQVSPFLHPSAFHVAYKFFYPYYISWRSRPTFAIISHEGTVRAIVPLLKRSGCYQLFGDVNGFNECGFLYDDSAVLPDVMQLLRQRFGTVEFPKIDCRSPLASFRGHSPQESDNVAINFGDSFDEYFSQLSKSVRQNIRTAYNRLRTDGYTASLNTFRPCAAADTAGQIGGGYLPIDQIISLYIRRHAERYGVATGLLKRWFLRHQSFATRYYTEAQNAFTSVLYINGEIAGFMSGLCDDSLMIVPRLSVSSDFRRYSPGLILICETIRHLQQATAIRCLDLSLGQEPYKYQLGGQCHKSYRFRI